MGAAKGRNRKREANDKIIKKVDVTSVLLSSCSSFLIDGGNFREDQ